jgi:hypothetical protein
MAVNTRVLRWAVIPLLLLVCVTIALWDLGVEPDVPGLPHPPHPSRDHASMKARGRLDPGRVRERRDQRAGLITAQQIVEWAASGPRQT